MTDPGIAARPITADDLIAALQQIEVLTATGGGLDPAATMQVHLLAGIGRAVSDPPAWHARPRDPASNIGE